MSIALLRSAYTWHKTKSILHVSKCLVLLSTISFMTNPTKARLALYTTTSLAYILIHMTLSTIVINIICLGEFLDYYYVDGSSQEAQSTKRPVSTWMQAAKYLLWNVANTCLREGGYGASSTVIIKPLVVLEENNLTSFTNNPMFSKYEERAYHVIATTEIIRTVLCCIYIMWSQYYLGQPSPVWLWGLVRSGTAFVDPGREHSQRRIHWLELLVLSVSLVTLWVAGSSLGTMAMSVVCILPSHALGERLLDSVNERVQTGLAMREFERSDKFKSKLLAQISHELRSPLLSMITVTEMSMKEETDTAKLENHAVVLDCSNQLLSMINDILDFGALDAGSVLIDSEKADVLTILESVTRSKRCKLRVCHKVPRHIEGDETKLHQVCRNLVNNAIKFMDKEEDVLVELDAFSAPELERQYAHDRPKYELCFYPIAREGIVRYEWTPLAILGIPQTNLEKITPMLIRALAQKKHGGILLPKLADTAPKTNLSQENHHASEKDPEFLVMSITDQGVGITEEAFSNIFSAFSQADNSFTRHYEGAGLGLSIVRELVDLMNGFLLVFSTPGKGSKFTVVLPMTQSVRRRRDELKRSPPVTPTPSPKRPPCDRPTPSPKRLPCDRPTPSPTRLTCDRSCEIGISQTESNHISKCKKPSKEPNIRLRTTIYSKTRCLVVDDNPLNRKILGRLLIQLGFEESLIEYAKDGREACEMFCDRYRQHQGFHLCLLDVMMPRMDGFTMLQHVRKYEREICHGEKRCRVLVVSANVVDIEKSLFHGADSYLPKPFSTTTFTKKVNQLFGREDDSAKEIT